MGYYPPNARHDKPGLFYPRRAVTPRSVKIDWTHPMTRDLKFFGLVGDGLYIEELVRGYTVDMSEVNQLEHTRGLKGNSLHADGSAASVTSIKPIEVSSNHSVLVSMIQHGTAGTTPAMLRFYNSSSAEDIQAGWDYFSNDSQVVSTFGVSYWVAKGDGIVTPINIPFTGVYTFASNFTANVYIDGRTQATESNSGTPGTITVDKLCVGEDISAGATYANGSLYLVALFTRELSRTEGMSLSNDPYQFLIPNSRG